MTFYLLNFPFELAPQHEKESETMLLLEYAYKRRLQPYVTWGRAKPEREDGWGCAFPLLDLMLPNENEFRVLISNNCTC